MKTKLIAAIATGAVFGLALPAFAADDGKALYDSKCAMCHGNDGVAKKMAAGSKNLNDSAWKKTETSDGVAKIIKDGKGKMKGLGGKLDEAQMKAVADYVLTLAK